MRLFVALAGCAVALSCAANDQEIQRALIQRDQQSAEFAAGVRRGDRRALESLHARQLSEASRPIHPDAEVNRQMLPYQRDKMRDELVLPPPVVQARPAEKPASSPSPLPGGPAHGVDPIPAQSARD
jgi:hypothetical protein